MKCEEFKKKYRHLLLEEEKEEDAEAKLQGDDEVMVTN